MIAVQKTSIYGINIQCAARTLLLTLLLVFQGLCLCLAACDGVDEQGWEVTRASVDCRYTGDFGHSHQHSETCGVALDQTTPMPIARVVYSNTSTMSPMISSYYGKILLSDRIPTFSAAGNIVYHQQVFLLTRIMRC